MSKPCITVSDFTIIYYQTVLNKKRLFTRNVESGDYSSEIKISRFFSVFFTKSYKSYLFIKENDSEC